MISLLPLLLAGQLLLPDPPVRPRVFRSDGAMRVSRLGSDDYAFFEAFPASGAGTTTACSTTPPTGAKGEVLTFTRTGNATCTKTASGGLATSGIANGDLVVMSANQPRVEYDSAGTLGLLVESTRSNVLVRSQELDDAAWTSNETAGTVTVTANYGTAPDGTVTADRLQVADCSTIGLYSARIQARSAGITTDVASVYLKGTSGSGSIGMMLGGAATYWAATCTYNASTWTRCATPAGSIPAASQIWIGCINNAVSTPNPGNTGAADVLVWGVQDEAGAYATSYIPTTSAAVTRNVETASFQVAVSQLPISIAWTSAQALPQGGASNDRIGVMSRELSGSGHFVVSYFQAQFRSDAVGSASGSALNGGTSAAGDRWATSHDVGGVLTSFKNGTQTATNTTAKTMNAATVVGIGASPAGLSHLDGIVSRVCVDPSPTRCR